MDKELLYWVGERHPNIVSAPSATPTAEPYPEPGQEVPDQWYGCPTLENAHTAYDALRGDKQKRREFEGAFQAAVDRGEGRKVYLRSVSRIDWHVEHDPQSLPEDRGLRRSEVIQGRLERLSDAELLIEGLISIRCYYDAANFLLLGCIGRRDIDEKYHFWWRYGEVALALGFRQLKPYLTPEQEQYEREATWGEFRAAQGKPPYAVEGDDPQVYAEQLRAHGLACDAEEVARQLAEDAEIRKRADQKRAAQEEGQ
jgi:hypothetical protein